MTSYHKTLSISPSGLHVNVNRGQLRDEYEEYQIETPDEFPLDDQGVHLSRKICVLFLGRYIQEYLLQVLYFQSSLIRKGLSECPRFKFAG